MVVRRSPSVKRRLHDVYPVAKATTAVPRPHATAMKEQRPSCRRTPIDVVLVEAADAFGPQNVQLARPQISSADPLIVSKRHADKPL